MTMQSFKGWKTVLFGAALAVVGILQQSGVESLVPDQYRGLVVAAIGAAVMILRTITTTPVGTSEK